MNPEFCQNKNSVEFVNIQNMQNIEIYYNTNI